MVKRKSPKARELPLFDLPLHANDEETDSAPGPTELDNAGDLPLDTDPAEPDAAERDVPQTLFPPPAADVDETPAAPEPAALEADDPAVPEADDPAVLEAVVPEPPAPPAPLKDRLLAGLLDLGIQLLVVVAAVVASQAMGLVLGLDDWVPFVILGLDFSFLYWFIPLAFWGQTPGMAWVGHSALGTDGEPLTFGQTALRWIGAVVTLALAGLPMLLAAGGRSLTDRLSDTKTVVI